MIKIGDSWVDPALIAAVSPDGEESCAIYLTTGQIVCAEADVAAIEAALIPSGLYGDFASQCLIHSAEAGEAAT